MSEYRGQVRVDIHKTKYAMYSKQDWVLLWIEMYGSIDGDHHKAWLIDQIARILKGTQIILSIAKWKSGEENERFRLSEPPKEYWDWVKEVKSGEDGEDTYGYDFGIVP